MTLTKKSDGIYLDDSVVDKLSKIDSVIFDCDGVLIDITKSYDSTIMKTTKYILENLAQIKNTIEIDFQIIDGFKSTGGFNDEVDLTYAAILCIVAAKKLEKNQKEFIFEVIENANSTGISSVEKYLESKTDISEIKKLLSFPSKERDSPVNHIFDQLFYGPELSQKLFGLKSKFTEPGLIEQDDVIVNESLIAKLKGKINSKIAIVTGRGKESVKYSLKQLMEKFDLENSFFLEDESRELAKPNPLPLINSIKGMSCTSTLYVGDSMEDLLMANKATEAGNMTIFCGIIGTSKNPSEKLELFQRNGVLLVLDSIDLLPKVLNLE